jgi:hypothetical protein
MSSKFALRLLRKNAARRSRPRPPEAEMTLPALDARLRVLQAELKQAARQLHAETRLRTCTHDSLTRQAALLAAVRKAQGLFISRHEPQEVFTELLSILVSATGSQCRNDRLCREEQPLLRRQIHPRPDQSIL